MKPVYGFTSTQFSNQHPDQGRNKSLRKTADHVVNNLLSNLCKSRE